MKMLKMTFSRLANLVLVIQLIGSSLVNSSELEYSIEVDPNGYQRTYRMPKGNFVFETKSRMENGITLGCQGEQKKDGNDIHELFMEDEYGQKEVVGLDLSEQLKLKSSHGSLEKQPISLRWWPEECINSLIKKVGGIDTDLTGCRSCPAGPDGANGPQGADGPAGAPGANGKDGKNGRDGFNGLDGEKGLPGDDGPVGPKGPQGKQGPIGIIGDRGDTGLDGRIGRPGATGPDGLPGQNGRPGIDGVDGINGRQGQEGTPGKAGSPGPSGIPAPSGPSGTPGASGLNGANGVNGANGFAGINGSPGNPGTCIPSFTPGWGWESHQGESTPSIVISPGNTDGWSRSQYSHDFPDKKVTIIRKTNSSPRSYANIYALPGEELTHHRRHSLNDDHIGFPEILRSARVDLP